MPDLDHPFAFHTLSYSPFTNHDASELHMNIFNKFPLAVALSTLLGSSLVGCFNPSVSKVVVLSRRNQSSRLYQSAATLPRISQNDLDELTSKGYVVVENFLPASLQEGLRQDVHNLRSQDKFSIAKIGQASTNALNTNIRVAETCFLGRGKLGDIPDTSRSQLYDVLDGVRRDLPQPLDTGLSEFLYAYYPSGGFYRRHRDAIPGSASILRKYSLLIYLNKDWKEEDKGKLRMHMDSGGDELPSGEDPCFMDIPPKGGTLVLFDSAQVPHEVLNTIAERVAIVGWFNRPVTASDISELSGGDISPARLVALAVAAGLVTVGLINILGT
jgi:SM-20-related protein